jgi:hypothetical protein
MSSPSISTWGVFFICRLGVSLLVMPFLGILACHFVRVTLARSIVACSPGQCGMSSNFNKASPIPAPSQVRCPRPLCKTAIYLHL